MDRSLQIKMWKRKIYNVKCNPTILKQYLVLSKLCDLAFFKMYSKLIQNLFKLLFTFNNVFITANI